jgi:hypothetical protein
VAAALQAPLWLHGRGLRHLSAPAARTRPGADPALALKAGLRALRLLARLPGWKDTCLFRSVVRILVLRRYGVDARLRIGVRREGDAAGVLAHAWVWCPEGEDVVEPDYQQLQPLA